MPDSGGDVNQGPRTAMWALPGCPDAVPLARAHTRGFLSATPTTEQRLVSDALLAVTELVANAVRHAPGPCELRLADDGCSLTIAVTDTSALRPYPRAPDADSGGFGLHLLERLAGTLDVREAPHGGKTVAAVLPSPSCRR